MFALGIKRQEQQVGGITLIYIFEKVSRKTFALKSEIR